MTQNDPDQRAQDRADLEAQLRELEERRDRLEAQMAEARARPLDPGEARRPADPAAMLHALEKILGAVQPILGNLTSAQERLITDRAEALSRNDTAAAAEATRMLDGISAIVEDMKGSVAQVDSAAGRIRASIESSGDTKDT